MVASNPLHPAQPRDSAVTAVRAWVWMQLRREFPGWLFVAALSTFTVGLIIFLHRFAHRFDINARWVFTKEGPIEHLTWIAGLAAASLLLLTARRRWTARLDRDDVWVAGSFALCSIGLFVFTMEEISWTQTFLQFQTPDTWAAINHQQETTLHNLLDKVALGKVAMWAGLALSAGSLALIAIGLVVREGYWSEIAPHWSLIPFSLLLGYAAVKTHSEVTEALLPVYFCFYGYRTFRRARERSEPSGEIAIPR